MRQNEFLRQLTGGAGAARTSQSAILRWFGWLAASCGDNLRCRVSWLPKPRCCRRRFNDPAAAALVASRFAGGPASCVASRACAAFGATGTSAGSFRTRQHGPRRSKLESRPHTCFEHDVLNAASEARCGQRESYDKNTSLPCASPVHTVTFGCTRGYNSANTGDRQTQMAQRLAK